MTRLVLLAKEPNAIRTINDPNNKIIDSDREAPRSLSMVVNIANGIVWVLPVKFPANIIVAPNSEIALAQANAKPDSIDGLANGRVNFQKVFQGEIPNVCDTSS